MCSLNRYAFIILFSILSSCSMLEEKNRSLVEVDEIFNKITSGIEIQLIDVRTEDEYYHSHIPGARNIQRSDMVNKDAEIEGLRIEKEKLEALLSALGINSNDSIYIYDAKGNVDAARLWWLLKLYGHDKVALINGGFIQWRFKNFETTEGFENIEPSFFLFSGKEYVGLLTEKESIANGNFEQIIDARSVEEYSGEITKNGAIRGGHIPAAIRFDYMEMLDGGSFKFKPKEALLQLLEEKGLDPDVSTVTYCHSGVRSALALFALREIAGMKNVTNYDGSWIEWSRDEALPVEN